MKHAYALAALLAVTPAAAEQCDTFSKSKIIVAHAPDGEAIPYLRETVTVNVQDQSMKIALDPANDLVAGVQYDSSNPYPWNLKADAPDDQLMTPIVKFKDGDISILPAMTLAGAKEVFSHLVAECLAGVPLDGPKTPAAFRSGFTGRIYVRPGVI
jgi:hypothetical protein